MEDSYIKIYKKMLDWQWFYEPNTLFVFIVLLLEANYKDSKVGMQEVKRGQCLTSIKRLQELTKLSPKKIRIALDHLQKGQTIGKQTTSQYSIITIKNYDMYQGDGKQRASKGQHNNNINILSSNKLESNILINKYIVEILDYLNQRANKNFKSTTNKTQTLINARINEGFTLEDFKTVIDKKCIEWMNTEMEKYLRPETLFGTKFEGYLNQTIKPTTKNIAINEKDIEDFFNYR